MKLLHAHNFVIFMQNRLVGHGGGISPMQMDGPIVQKYLHHLITEHRAVPSVNAEQASKRAMWRSTRLKYGEDRR